MKFKCPKCKSSNVTIQSKSIYFRNAAIFLVIVLLCYIEFNSLTVEKDVDRVVILGFLLSGSAFVLCLIASLYYFISAFLIKKTIYRCQYCKSKSQAALKVRKDAVKIEALLNSIRKK